MTREELLKIAKPIPFYTEMVRAIQDGKKTVTRRKAKPQPPKEANGIYERMDNGNFQLKVAPYETIYDYEIKPPYETGDYLYVQETWAIVGSVLLNEWRYVYEADGKGKQCFDKSFWKSLKHMPKEAARIFLRVTDVRVERLQDINGYGVLAEGVNNGKSNPTMGARWENMQLMAFSELWNSTVKKSDLECYGWNANPWVWVISFERVKFVSE